MAQVETTDTVNKASAAATAYFNQTKPKNIVSSTLQFSPNSAQTAFTVTATSWVQDAVPRRLDFIIKKDSESGAPSDCQGSYFDCVQADHHLHGRAQGRRRRRQQRRGGHDARRHRLHVHPVHKIDALKPAAKDLVDIVIWNDQSQYTSRIALAPFAEAVNVGTTLAPLVRGTVTSGTQTSSPAAT